MALTWRYILVGALLAVAVTGDCVFRGSVNDDFPAPYVTNKTAIALVCLHSLEG